MANSPSSTRRPPLVRRSKKKNGEEEVGEERKEGGEGFEHRLIHLRRSTPPEARLNGEHAGRGAEIEDEE